MGGSLIFQAGELDFFSKATMNDTIACWSADMNDTNVCLHSTECRWCCTLVRSWASYLCAQVFTCSVSRHFSHKEVFFIYIFWTEITTYLPRVNDANARSRQVEREAGCYDLIRTRSWIRGRLDWSQNVNLKRVVWACEESFISPDVSDGKVLYRSKRRGPRYGTSSPLQ